MADDYAQFTDTARVVAVPDGMTKDEVINFARRHDVVVLEGRARVEKFWDGDTVPYEVIDSGPNLALTAGATLMWQILGGLGGTNYSSTNARIAVGSSTTAASAGQTALVAELGRQLVDGAPTVSGASISWTATFLAGTATGNWREMAMVNAGSGGTLLNRLVSDWGTKPSVGASWIATMTITAA